MARIERDGATAPTDGGPGRRASRRRERPACGSLAGGQQPAESRAAEPFPEYMPDPIEVGKRDFLVARNISADFAAKLLAKIPGAVLVPFTIEAGSVIFPRVPSRGFARRLQVTCKRGHPLADAYVTKSGQRVCRLCTRFRRRAKHTRRERPVRREEPSRR